MKLTPEFVLQVAIYLVTLGSLYGAFHTKIGALEKNIDRLERKQDKYNNLQERMASVESSSKSAHHRMDEYFGVVKG